MIGGFGQTGQTQSQQYSWQACIICRAPIRVSMFLLLTFAFQLASVMQGGFDFWIFLLLCGQEAILIATVLGHEFGHGSMARAIGGEIDHILLWPFGGICFTSRPRGITDHAQILKNELWVVMAGPATHFLMAPAWGLLLYFFSESLRGHCGAAPAACSSCEGLDCVWAFLNPVGAVPDVVATVGEAAMLLWRLLGEGVRINVALFLFNVFLPMYPADGAKILTVTLMHCCGVAPRSAATVLVCCSSICACALILYALRTMLGAAGPQSMMAGVVGWLGVMSLIEAYRIHDLKQQSRLNTHPLFRTARSAVATQRDAHGSFHRINDTDLDDDEQGGAGVCCLCSPFCGPATPSSEEESEPTSAEPGVEGAPLSQLQLGGRCEDRQCFLDRLEAQAAQKKKTVRQLEEESLAVTGRR